MDKTKIVLNVEGIRNEFASGMFKNHLFIW